MCIERTTDEELHLIRESVECYSQIDVSLESYFSLNERFIDFHAQIVQAANNDILRSQYASIIDRIRIINRMHMNQTLSIEDVKIRHLNIIGAIIDRNAMLAEALINSSITRIIMYLKNSIE